LTQLIIQDLHHSEYTIEDTILSFHQLLLILASSFFDKGTEKYNTVQSFFGNLREAINVILRM